MINSEVGASSRFESSGFRDSIKKIGSLIAIGAMAGMASLGTAEAKTTTVKKRTVTAKTATTTTIPARTSESSALDQASCTIDLARLSVDLAAKAPEKMPDSRVVTKAQYICKKLGLLFAVDVAAPDETSLKDFIKQHILEAPRAFTFGGTESAAAIYKCERTLADKKLTVHGSNTLFAAGYWEGEALPVGLKDPSRWMVLWHEDDTALDSSKLPQRNSAACENRYEVLDLTTGLRRPDRNAKTITTQPPLYGEGDALTPELTMDFSQRRDLTGAVVSINLTPVIQA